MKIFLILIGLVVVLGAGFLLLRGDSTTNSLVYDQEMTGTSEIESAEDGSSAQPNSNSGQTSSLVQLANRGAVRCDITITTNNAQIGDYKGVLYSDGRGRLRTEMWNIKTPNNIIYALVSDPYIYNWTNQESLGLRQNAPKDSSGQIVEPNSIGAPYDFSCTTWNVNSSILQPPAGVTFSEMPRSTR